MIDLASQTNLLNQFHNVWTGALLVFVRCMAFVTMAPPTSHKSIPVMVKIAYAISLTLMILPTLKEPEYYPKNHEFIYQIVLNIFVGLFIGWLSMFVMEIVKIAGEIINSQMSLQSASLFDPGSQTQTTIIGKFFDLLVFVVFLSCSGVEKVILGLSKSFNTFPILITSFDINMLKVLNATYQVVLIGFLISSPIVMTLLAIDLILGIMSRAAPQINAFQISFGIKPSVGVILLLLLLPALFPVIKGLCEQPFRFMY